LASWKRCGSAGGKGVLRVTGEAINTYLAACTVTAAQADGLACVTCGADFLTVATPHVPVGRSHTGSQVFACSHHTTTEVAQTTATSPITLTATTVDAIREV
jgi:hypothetical protein